jgi:hypothetical protein
MTLAKEVADATEKLTQRKWCSQLPGAQKYRRRRVHSDEQRQTASVEMRCLQIRLAFPRQLSCFLQRD